MESRQHAERRELSLRTEVSRTLLSLTSVDRPLSQVFLLLLLGKHFFLLIFYGHATWHMGSLFPDQGWSALLAVKVQHLSHWTTREAPGYIFQHNEDETSR